MFINKIGQQHIEFGVNCQDFGTINDRFKLVCDGCSEGLHTEVGAKTFVHLSNLGCDVQSAFKKMISIFGQTSSLIKNYLCFTILKVTENEYDFNVDYCGDGFIILQDLDGNISFEELNDGEFPKYYAYNYVDSDALAHYKDGVSISSISFSKEKYKNVGIASDGLRYIFSAKDYEKEEFIEILKSGKESKLKRFINKNQQIFKDDITIAF